MNKNKRYSDWAIIVIVLVIAGLYYLYIEYQQTLRAQNRFREVDSRLVIIQKLGNQNDMSRTVDENIKHVVENTPKNLNDEQPSKKEEYYVVQKGKNLSKKSSTNKITIQELKIVNGSSSKEAIFTNGAFN